MKTNTRIVKFIAAAALLASTAPVASATGLLGQRYASATFDWVFPDDNRVDDGRGVTLGLNLPLTTNIDLSLNYSYLDSGADFEVGEGETISVDASGQSLMFGGTFYMPAGNVKPFISAGLGWQGIKVDNETDNDMTYQIVPGVEIPAGDRATLTLYAAWSDYFDNEPEDDGVWTFGALAEFEVSTQWSVLVRTTLDDDSNWGLSAGALVRF